jgi:hypothetical protein
MIVIQYLRRFVGNGGTLRKFAIALDEYKSFMDSCNPDSCICIFLFQVVLSLFFQRTYV